MRDIIAAKARANGVDPALALAVSYQESGWNMHVVSVANAVGAMQVIPATSDWISGVVGRRLDPLDPHDNATTGVVLLKILTPVGEQRAAGDRGLLPGPALGAGARDVPRHPAVRRQRAGPQGPLPVGGRRASEAGPGTHSPVDSPPWTRLSATPSSGSVLDGRYHVGPRLARGGMATVYEAHDNRLDRTIALKVMHPSLADDEEFVSRFIREAHSAARLSHPNVVAVYDQGADQGHVFLAMELVRGRTLRDLIREPAATSARARPSRSSSRCSPRSAPPTRPA